MRLAIVVVVALFAASVAARVTPSFCSSESQCTAADCTCCNGYCVDFRDAPVRKLGETCDDSTSYCNGQCAGVLNCLNGRCVKTTVPISCPCAPVELGLGCLGTCTNHTCYGSNLPGGAGCKLNEECAAGTCANGICTPTQSLPAPTPPPCISSNIYNFPCTTAGQICVNTISSLQCAAPAGDNGYCQVDNDCLSGACNTTANPNFCVARFSAPAGQFCDSHAACASHWCFDNHCADSSKRLNQGDGQPCPSGAYNCAPGLKCVGTSERVCRKVTGYSCESAMTTSLCGGQVNFSPRNGQATALQQLNALSSTGSAVCACGNGGYQCVPAYYSPQSCDGAYFDMMVLFKADDPLSPYSAANTVNFEGLFKFSWARYPAFARQSMAKYMCCALGPNGDLGIQYLMESTGIVETMDYMLDCSLATPDMVALAPEIMTGTVCNPAKIPTAAQLFKGNVRYRGRAQPL